MENHEREILRGILVALTELLSDDLDAKEFYRKQFKVIEGGFEQYKAAVQPPKEALQLNTVLPDVSGVSTQGEPEMNFKNKIYEKPNGLKEYRFTYLGERHSVYARTKSELWKKYVALKGSKKAQPKKKPSILTFHAWLDKWFALYKENTLVEATVKTYSSYVKRIKDNIKNKPLKNLSAEDIQVFLMSVPQTRTRKAFYDRINDCLDKAAKLNLIKINVMNAVESVKHKYKKGIALTKEQERVFIKALSELENKELALYFYICLLTGGRRSEILNLTWEDFNFNDRTLHIRGTKTATSNRIVPISDKLYDLTFPNKGTGRLFSLLGDYVTKQYKEIAAPKTTLKSLRHTFATRCLENNVNMKTLQLWLGHATYKQTADTYSHVLEAFNKTEIDKLNN